MELVSQTDSAVPSLGMSKGDGNRTEAMLIAEARAGSVVAFEHLVQRCQAKVFRVVRPMAHTREDAEEVVQSAFVLAFRHLARFRGDSRFCTWIVRIAINEALMKRRGRRWNEISIDHSRENQEGIPPRELEDGRPSPEERCSHEEMRSILAATIGQLPPHYRTVFQLRDVEGFSTRETARALALSSTAVKSRLRRARIALRGSLHKYTRALGVFRNQRNQRFSAPGFIKRSTSRRELNKTNIF